MSNNNHHYIIPAILLNVKQYRHNFNQPMVSGFGVRDGSPMVPRTPEVFPSEEELNSALNNAFDAINRCQNILCAFELGLV